MTRLGTKAGRFSVMSMWESSLRLRIRVQGSGFRVQGSGFRVQGLRKEGVGFRVKG